MVLDCESVISLEVGEPVKQDASTWCEILCSVARFLKILATMVMKRFS
jgi:hypothetical protein